jgi:rubrerythrin
VRFSPSSSDGLTRGDFILRGALATAAVYGAGSVGPFVERALAQSDASDSAILDFALRLEILEETFYKQALGQVPGMSAEVHRIARVLHDHEHQHRLAIAEVIRQLGIKSSPPPKLDFGDSFSSEARFLEVAQQLEDTGVAAYNGAAPQITSPDLLAFAGTVVQIEARHASVIRDLRGQPIADGAFDKPLDEAQVGERVKPFIH